MIQDHGMIKYLSRGGVLVKAENEMIRRRGDAYVPPGVVSRFRIPEGAIVTGHCEEGDRGPYMTEVTDICGMEPDVFARRTLFRDLTVINPDVRFDLSLSGDKDLRALDLISPIGKGTRGLIVSPPRAGKTTLLEKLAAGIKQADPGARIMALLIDERPEEVTHFQRAVDAEVFSSSLDQGAQQHAMLTELMLGHVRTELECGRDVVVLVDSLTRMGRAFNQVDTGQTKIMSGGVGAGALDIPRRFFGMARNVENGGSITVLATVLVDTGSRMDEVIFEEFKGTGNCEMVLDRGLAEKRLFPALNIRQSGTRKEDLLFDASDMEGINGLRRVLADLEPEDALRHLSSLIKQWPTNQELLTALLSK